MQPIYRKRKSTFVHTGLYFTTLRITGALLHLNTKKKRSNQAGCLMMLFFYTE